MFNKKFYLVGLAVLLSVSLIVIGCEGPAGADGANGADSTVPGKDGEGTPGTPADQILDGTHNAAVTNAFISKLSKGVKLSVGNLTIDGPGVVDFRDLDVTIAGTVDTTTASGPVYLVFAEASVDFVSGGGFTLGTNGSMVIGSPAQKAAWGSVVSGGSFIGKVEDLSEATGPVAVAKYTLGAADAIPADVTVTVYEELTVDGGSLVPGNIGAKVVAIGKVVLTATNDVALSSPNRVNIDNAEVVYAGTETIRVKLPGVVDGTLFTITGGKVEVDGPNTVRAAVRGSGELAFVGTVDELTAQIYALGQEKSKKITFAPVGAAPQSLATPVKLKDGSDITADEIVFPEGVNILSGTVTLSGKVGVGSEKAITYTGAYDLVLENGSSLVRAGGAQETLLKTHVDKDEPDLTLTGAANTVLKVLATDGLAVSAGAIVFDGPVDFEDNLELTAVGATFKGATTFTNGKGLVLTTVTTSTVTLQTTAAWLGNPYTDASSVAWSKVLGNNQATDLVLTPTANTKLVFDDGRTVTQSSATTGAHSIKIGGKAVLGAGATYTVASDTTAVGTLEVDTSGELKLSTGNELLVATPPKARLVLGNGAKLTGAGKVVAGRTEIIGGSNGWIVSTVGTATTGSVTITLDAITVSAGAKLGGTTGTTVSSITTTAEDDAKAQLDLVGTIDVNTAGSIVLIGTSAANSAILHLIEDANPGKVVLNSASGYTTGVTTVGTASNLLTASSGTVGATDIYISKTAPKTGEPTGTPASKTDVLLEGAAASITTTTEAGSISAGGTDAYLISPQADAWTGTIVNGDKLLGSNPL